MQLDQALETFVIECGELITEMEATLLEIEASAIDSEQVNSIFRAAHTIKGSAGLFGLDHVVRFTHILESVLDRVRDGEAGFDAALRDLLLACGDHICALIGPIAQGDSSEHADLTTAGEPLLGRLRHYLPPPSTDPAARAAAAEAPAGPGPARLAQEAPQDEGPARWQLSLRFGAEVLRNGMDPLSFLRYLSTLGTVTSIVTLPDAIPDADAMDPECCYLGFELGFETHASAEAILDVFEFVRADSEIRLVPLKRALAPPPADAAPVRPASTGETRAAATPSIRIDADKLDHLINRVGELVIAAAGTQLAARRAGLTELLDSAAALSSLVEEVRDGALQLRMVRIGATFNRFQRVVHDVAQELGKDIRLVIRGEDTELDKTVVERIADPLTHLVRNAMDHGISDPADRQACGKTPYGTITLNAYHDSGSVVIEVSDDGRGLNRERILQKGIERGMVEAGRELDDQAIFALVFEPGFSTAEQVTKLSGRGVGMDVVKRSITALRGTIEIESSAGIGTTVRVRLPLTLAIIDGFLVGLGQSTFAVPLDMVEECLEGSTDAEQGFIDLRGRVLPLIRLRELFEVEGPRAIRESILVVRHGGRKAGLVVDTLHGECQTVIKPLGRMFRQLRCIVGSTILGSGEVGLILDVPALMQEAARPRLSQRSPISSSLHAIPGEVLAFGRNAGASG